MEDFDGLKAVDGFEEELSLEDNEFIGLDEGDAHHACEDGVIGVGWGIVAGGEDGDARMTGEGEGACVKVFLDEGGDGGRVFDGEGSEFVGVDFGEGLA
jgi:hypothetical protein